MKIVHVITGLGTGGAEVMLYRLLTEQRRYPHEVSVVSLTTVGNVGEDIQALGIPTTGIDMHRSGMDPAALWHLARHVRAERPDIVQTWMYQSDLLGGLVGKAAGAAVVWGIHSSTLHHDAHGRSAPIARRLSSVVSSLVPDAIVSCSEVAKETHIEAGYDPRRIHVIPNGFDLDLFKPIPTARAALREELGLPQSTPLIALVARYDPRKDHQSFISAARILLERRPDVHFLLVGWGMDASNAEVQAMIAEAGVGANFHLFWSRDDMAALFSALDIATLTSVSEAFPLVLGEAMACGVPCVATDAGDSAQIVGSTGIIVPPGDPQAIADGWANMLDRSPRERAALGCEARQRIERLYSLPDIADRYISLYERIVDERNRRRGGGLIRTTFTKNPGTHQRPAPHAEKPGS